eukprot:3431093-Pyramimonas_sp.AAC.1
MGPCNVKQHKSDMGQPGNRVGKLNCFIRILNASMEPYNVQHKGDTCHPENRVGKLNRSTRFLAVNMGPVNVKQCETAQG